MWCRVMWWVAYEVLRLHSESYTHLFEESVSSFRNYTNRILECFIVCLRWDWMSSSSLSLSFSKRQTWYEYKWDVRVWVQSHTIGLNWRVRVRAFRSGNGISDVCLSVFDVIVVSAKIPFEYDDDVGDDHNRYKRSDLCCMAAYVLLANRTNATHTFFRAPSRIDIIRKQSTRIAARLVGCRMRLPHSIWDYINMCLQMCARVESMAFVW